MAIQACEEHTDECVVCGDVCGEQDAVWVEDQTEKEAIDEAGSAGAQWVCAACAAAAGIWRAS